MSHATDLLHLISENWFLQEPAFFALYCQQQLHENPRMECAFRCGQGRIEYNPLLLEHKDYADAEQLMRIELIRLFLKHPYERQPDGCCREAMAVGSDVTIADGYCMLHHDKLPLRTPGYYHLPLGQYYEWYAKAVQQQLDDERRDNPRSRPSQGAPDNSSADDRDSDNDSSESSASDADKSALWQEDSLQRQRIDDLINRTTDWGTLPAQVVERIQASTRSRIDSRLVWQGFRSAIISSQRSLTRMRPNRRTGFLQMGSRRQFDTRLLIAIDVSGSVTADMLSAFYGAVNRLFCYGMAQIDLCQFDAEMGDVQAYDRAQTSVEVCGRGGTSFQPVIDYLYAHAELYDGLLILTDGQAPPPAIPSSGDRKSARQHASRIPILWVCHDRAAYDAHHGWMQQFGRCCHL